MSITSEVGNEETAAVSMEIESLFKDSTDEP